MILMTFPPVLTAEHVVNVHSFQKNSAKKAVLKKSLSISDRPEKMSLDQRPLYLFCAEDQQVSHKFTNITVNMLT